MDNVFVGTREALGKSNAGFQLFPAQAKDCESALPVRTDFAKVFGEEFP